MWLPDLKLHAMSNAGRYFLLTIPQHLFTPFLPPGVQWIRGQLERGERTGYLHWQLSVAFPKTTRPAGVKRIFGNGIHIELSRSDAADSYVWKDDTRVEGTQFELGAKKTNRANAKDWEAIWNEAKNRNAEQIPADVRIRCYSQIRRIGYDYMAPIGVERECYVYWGTTGTGKSRRAWGESGFDAYPKGILFFLIIDPRTKFWCGYNSHENVVIDEFRGGIDIAHLLRWLDRYPVIVETKGGAIVFNAKRIWITSNLDPREWYPGLDAETMNALLRRLKITHFNPPL